MRQTKVTGHNIAVNHPVRRERLLLRAFLETTYCVERHCRVKLQHSCGKALLNQILHYHVGATAKQTAVVLLPKKYDVAASASREDCRIVVDRHRRLRIADANLSG